MATAYLEKAGYGARAAAPVVKCVFTQLSGATAADPVVLSDPLDTNDLTPAPSQSLRDTSCFEGQITSFVPAD